MSHITSSQLLDYYKENLNTDDNARVKAHLAECATCQWERDTMVSVLTGLQQADFTEPNPSTTQKLTLAFRKKQARLASRLRQTATLEFDSWANPATANLRRHMGQRQMLFSEGAYDIDLQVANQTGGHNFDIQGQVMKAIVPEERDAFSALAGLQIRLYDKNDEEWWGVTDENGRFSFLQLAFGIYAFQLMLDDRDIIFEDLDILA